MRYKPSLPYDVPAHLLTPTVKSVKGVNVKTYSEPTDDNIIFCSFKTYGGTETESNGVITILDTANVETWFRPDIEADCRIMLADSKEVYEILGKPEDVEQSHLILKFKVQRVTGGA